MYKLFFTISLFDSHSILFSTSVMKEEISKNVNDPLVDLTQIKDQEVDEVGRYYSFSYQFI